MCSAARNSEGSAGESAVLAVTGIGMVSPVGLDVASSCAAARAGIRGMVGLDGFPVFDEQAVAEVPLVVHMVPHISAGLFGTARLLQLALSAIDDLRSSARQEPAQRLGLIVVARSELHRKIWIDRVRSSTVLERNGLDVEALETDLAADQKALADTLLPNLIRHAQIAVEPRATRTILSDQTGFITALEQASAWLADGTCETCWIGGCDSYLDPPVLEALGGLRLLHTPDHSVGLIPGELACFIALEDARRLTSTSQSPRALIHGFAREGAAIDERGDQTQVVEALVRTMSRVEAGQEPGLILVNLNGDPTRALEWGRVQIRRALQGVRGQPPFWVPPLYFGEIGAATGPASVALLAQGWARGYAPASRATVCMMEESSSRGAFSVSARGES